MSGFEDRWLSLREPVDRTARNHALVQQVNAYLTSREEGSTLYLLDIGCGTGSTWRSLSGSVPEGSRWHLVDHDARLLDRARERIGDAPNVTFQCHDLADLDGLPLDRVGLVTASALFDLCSERFCTAFVAKIAQHGCGLYAALNYDGTTHWLPAHPYDRQAVESMNRHQLVDKGFGPALGPDAAETLRRLFVDAGYSVSVAASPWQIDADHQALHRAFVAGFREPIMEMGLLSDAAREEWLAFRLSQTALPMASCRVGHLDLLALPR